MGEVSTDVKSLTEIVKERLGSKVVEVLPDEVFDKMLEAAVRDLITAPAKKAHYDEQPKPPLQKLIYDQILAQMNERIKAELSKPEWQAVFNEKIGGHVSEGVEKYINEHAAKIWTDLLQQGIAASVSYAIQNAQRNY